MDPFDAFDWLWDFWRPWRFIVCLALSVWFAFWLHGKLGPEPWVYFLSVPSVLAGVVLGIIWEARSR
jgi:hypothetical protein